MEALLIFLEDYLYLNIDQFKFNIWKINTERRDYPE